MIKSLFAEIDATALSGVQNKNRRAKNSDANKLNPEDRPAHDWYRFVLSYPPHLVRHYLEEFQLNSKQAVLDPFCGTGTTIVECRKQGIPSIGIEANPMLFFASSTKTDWDVNPSNLLEHARSVGETVQAKLLNEGIDDTGFCQSDGVTLKTLAPDKMALLLKNCISPLPLHKALVLPRAP